MDKREEEICFDTSQWQERYRVERQLENIYQFEEMQWQRRGGVKWILKGDTNSGYFHSIANDRKKKCTIFHWKMRAEKFVMLQKLEVM
jgi:hypothetical protein